MTKGSLEELERSFLDIWWHLDPVEATRAGVPDYDDRLGRYGTEALRPHLAALKSLANALEEADLAGREAEIDRTALLNVVRVALRRLERERPQRRNPEFWLSHLLAGLHTLVVRSDRPPAARGRSVVGRLEDVAAFLDDARETLDQPVRLFAETALRVSAAGRQLIRDLPGTVMPWVPDEAERLTAAARAADEALTAFDRDLARWCDAGSDGFAIGEESFNFRMHYEHALRDTAPELWRYGHHLVEEVEAHLVAHAGRMGEPSWQDLVDRLRADHPDERGLVAAYAAEMRRARDFVVERGLAAIPDGALDVVPTPPFMRPLVPFAAYDAPGPYSSDGTGLFYVTEPDPTLAPAARERILRDHCRHEIAVTALHEGFPGHHLQLAHARHLGSHTRKNLWTPLTVEGWALYCEDMMGEEGFYRTPEAVLFQRVHLLWRAVRVLLDVGLHTRAMTFDGAVTELVERLHVDRSAAEAEVRRYCAWPGYQLCYAVGRRELRRLRDDFRAQRAGEFTLRGFHDAVLAYGGLPVTLIRWGLGLGE